ncbi:MAG: hypothetical protein Q8P67_22620, partial [archaeon]|nr:hypothetical protein [archaeon]
MLSSFFFSQWNTNLNYTMSGIPQSMIQTASPLIETDLLAKIRIHQGFHLAFQSVYHDVVTCITSLGSEKTLYLSGHSLGGALATISFFYFLVVGVANPIYGVYTFGQPRVANDAFDDFVSVYGDCVIQRVSQLGDIVPLLPPKKPYGFKSCGSFVQIKRGGEITFGASQEDLDAFKNQRITLLSSSLAAHRVVNYVTNIQLHLDTSSRRARGTGHKLTLIAVSALYQKRRGQSFLVVRAPSRGNFSSRTKRVVKGKTPIWNEEIEVPEIFYGDELVIEVWNGSTCSGCAILSVVDFQDSERVEFALASRPGKRERARGSVVVGFKYFSHMPLPEEQVIPRLFDTPISDVILSQRRLGLEVVPEMPVFLARLSEVVLERCLAVPGCFQPRDFFPGQDYALQRSRLDAIATPSLSDKDPPQLVMHLLSDWLSSLPVAPISSKEYDILVRIFSTAVTLQDQLGVLKAVVKGLPPYIHAMLALLCSLVEQLVHNAPLNDSSPASLAAQLGPHLFFTRHPHTGEPCKVIDDETIVLNMAEVLFIKWRAIFADHSSYPLGCGFHRLGPATLLLEFHSRLMLPLGPSSPPSSLFSDASFSSSSPSSSSFPSFPSLSSSSSSSSFPSSLLGSPIMTRIAIGSIPYLALVSELPDIHLLNLHTQHFDGAISIPVSFLGDSPDLPRCIGLWDLGPSPLAATLNGASTWLLAFDRCPPLFAVPSGTAGTVTFSKSTISGGFSCGCATPLGSLLARIDGSLALLSTDLQWSQRTPIRALANICRVLFVAASDTLWLISSNLQLHVIRMADLSTEGPPLPITLPPLASDDASLELRAAHVVDSTMWVSTTKGQLYVVDVHSMQCVHSHQEPIDRLAFCSLGTEGFIVVAGEDGQAEVWDTSSLQRLAHFSTYSSGISSVLLLASPGGSEHLYLAGKDASVSIWRLAGLAPELASLQDSRQQLRSSGMSALLRPPSSSMADRPTSVVMAPPKRALESPAARLARLNREKPSGF